MDYTILSRLKTAGKKTFTASKFETWVGTFTGLLSWCTIVLKFETTGSKIYLNELLYTGYCLLVLKIHYIHCLLLPLKIVQQHIFI